MQLCLNFNMVFVLIIGSKLIITNQGSTIGVGQISGMLTYGMQILMSLMMLSMIYVMLTMSAESAKRIYEVLLEQPTLKNRLNRLGQFLTVLLTLTTSVSNIRKLPTSSPYLTSIFIYNPA